MEVQGMLVLLPLGNCFEGCSLGGLLKECGKSSRVLTRQRQAVATRLGRADVCRMQGFDPKLPSLL